MITKEQLKEIASSPEKMAAAMRDKTFCGCLPGIPADVTPEQRKQVALRELKQMSREMWERDLADAKFAYKRARVEAWLRWLQRDKDAGIERDYEMAVMLLESAYSRVFHEKTENE